MNFDKKSLLLYVVTDSRMTGKNGLAAGVEEAVKSGATFVQLREKDVSFEEFVSTAREIKGVCKKYSVPFVINDDVDVALEVDADGVHIGQSDEELKIARSRLGNDKIIGVSVGNAEQAMKAEEGGADYIGVGAVFVTSTKPDAVCISRKELKEISENVDIPIVCIGGIDETNALTLSGIGINGIAVVSAIFASKDIGKATQMLRKSAQEAVKVKS